jgi:hypothetical protein
MANVLRRDRAIHICVHEEDNNPKKKLSLWVPTVWWIWNGTWEVCITLTDPQRRAGSGFGEEARVHVALQKKLKYILFWRVKRSICIYVNLLLSSSIILNSIWAIQRRMSTTTWVKITCFNMAHVCSSKPKWRIARVIPRANSSLYCEE